MSQCLSYDAWGWGLVIPKRLESMGDPPMEAMISFPHGNAQNTQWLIDVNWLREDSFAFRKCFPKMLSAEFMIPT